MKHYPCDHAVQDVWVEW